MSLGKDELSALTRIFSPTVFRDLGRSGRSPLFARLVKSTSVVFGGKPRTVGEVFDHAFSLLRTLGYRDEYVYRTAITQKILLGRHSLTTASLLHEVRTGSCKADVVVLNGTSTAYEIKSERDSLTRLRTQLDNYRRVFASVNVVTSPSHLREVLAVTPFDVGVLVLSRRFTIQTEREAQACPGRVSPLMILDLLRAPEAIAILRSLDIDVPLVPNTQIRGALRERFASLEPSVVHDQMVTILKHARSQATIADFVGAMPQSLKSAALSVRLDRAGRDRIESAISTPLDVALAWS